jgi:hypothetical protein
MDVAVGFLRCTLRFGDKTASHELPSGQGLELSMLLRSCMLMTYAVVFSLSLLYT